MASIPAAANRDATRSFADLCAPLAADLEEVERVFQRELHSELPSIQRMVDHLGHYRGKRLRPVLLLLTARASGDVTAEHHLLAAVVEMIHTATLVHDDVLDAALVRRHVPTVHARWGNSSSVLLGDLLFTHAFYLASLTRNAVACRLIGQATNRVCEGELRQISEQGNLSLSEADYLEIIQGKTAELTACCCRIGALFAGAEEGVIEAMARFGRALGIAFQIADDVLDLVGVEQEAGKSLGTDVEQQKLTLPLIRLLAEAAPEERARYRQVLASNTNHKRDLLREALEASDALPYSRRVAEQFAAEARGELGCLPESPWRDLLEELADRVVHRRS